MTVHSTIVLPGRFSRFSTFHIECTVTEIPAVTVIPELGMMFASIADANVLALER